MKASLGRTVIVHNLPSNGAMDHPAVITRAWSERSTAEGPVAVNLTVFPDCAAPLQRGSVMLFDNAAAAHDHVVENPRSVVAHWPERAG